MEFPKDPVILLSYVNLKLRDFYPSLEILCEECGMDMDALKEKLAQIDYDYDSKTNQFV